MISRVKGTQDFCDLRLFNGILEKVRSFLQRYNFEEIATPILEHEELFRRTLGVHTDVVSKEMFIIEKHGERDDEDRICLRPELTAPTVRSFLEHGIQVLPWKVFSWGPVFRYERPQKGRFRQFHQINAEIIGSQNSAHDIHVLAMLDRLFREEFSLEHCALRINFLGCPSDRQQYREALKLFLEKNISTFCATCKIRKDSNIMRVFDCKNATCASLLAQAPFIADNLCEPCAQEWRNIQTQLQVLSVSFSYSPTLVRGLDYYNKTVFEWVSDNLGAQNAFCGGGRYELASQLGARQEVPSLGMAIGIERLLLLLEPQAEALLLPYKKTLHYIMPLDEARQSLALFIADTLLAAGLVVDVDLEGGSLKSMMRSANRLGALYAIMIGEEEWQARAVTVKHMITGEQARINQTELINFLKK